MSDASIRWTRPSDAALRLIRVLVAQAPELRLTPNWLDTLRVQAMSDGGMGSMKLATEDVFQSHRLIGRRVAEVQFADADGVAVIASLNVDRDEQLLELDLWKVDFSPVIQLPAALKPP